MVVDLLGATSVWERLVIWAPAIIVGTGIVLATLILLGRAFMATLREAGHPKWVYGSLAALVGVIVLLTWLGVELPRE